MSILTNRVKLLFLQWLEQCKQDSVVSSDTPEVVWNAAKAVKRGQWILFRLIELFLDNSEHPKKDLVNLKQSHKQMPY